MTEKTPPADISAESAVLGSILLNREAIIAVASWLAPAMFYLEKHAWIYAAMLACFGRREPPDTRLVAAELRRQGQLDPVGGIAYLSELVDATPTSYHVEYYGRIVERTAVLRRLIVASGQIARLGYDEQAELEQAIGDAYRALDTATARAADERALMPIGRVVEERYAALHAAAERDEGPQMGLPTGLVDYDDLTGGLYRQHLVVLAARPSVGKSSLALTIACNVAEAGGRVDVFSLEMGRMQCLDRLVAMRTGMNLLDVRQLRLNERALAAYYEALGWAAALPLAIDETPALTLADMRARLLRRAAQAGPPALIVVDYLGLMRVPKAKSRYDEISEIARGLKQLAKELDAPLLALCQLSRAVESRTSHVPMLSDLRESGEIEQSADQVAFIYRDELYNRDSQQRGVAELHIAKHRDGPVGVVPLRFDAATTRFLDLSYRTADGYDGVDPGLSRFREAA